MSKIGGEVKITFILYLFPGMSGFHIVMQDTDSTNRQTPKTIQYIVIPPGKKYKFGNYDSMQIKRTLRVTKCVILMEIIFKDISLV